MTRYYSNTNTKNRTTQTLRDIWHTRKTKKKRIHTRKKHRFLTAISVVSLHKKAKQENIIIIIKITDRQLYSNFNSPHLKHLCSKITYHNSCNQNNNTTNKMCKDPNNNNTTNKNKTKQNKKKKQKKRNISSDQSPRHWSTI